MTRISLSPLSLRILAAATLVVAAGACSDPFALGPANIENRVDTTLMYSLSTAEIGEPSAYDMIRRSTAVTESGVSFDFVFDIRDGVAELLPLGAIGLSVGAGLQHVDDDFDAISDPPTGNYVTSEPVEVHVGDVLVGRSRGSTSGCGFFGSIARYGKFRVLTIDAAAGEITLELLVNGNCAFRNLEPGIPTD